MDSGWMRWMDMLPCGFLYAYPKTQEYLIIHCSTIKDAWNIKIRINAFNLCKGVSLKHSLFHSLDIHINIYSYIYMCAL